MPELSARKEIAGAALWLLVGTVVAAETRHKHAQFLARTVGKRSTEELYAIKRDPDHLENQTEHPATYRIMNASRSG